MQPVVLRLACELAERLPHDLARRLRGVEGPVCDADRLAGLEDREIVAPMLPVEV